MHLTHLLSSLIPAQISALPVLSLFSLLSLLPTSTLALSPFSQIGLASTPDVLTGLFAQTPTGDVDAVADLYKWTLGSIFAGISTLGIAFAWIGRFFLVALFNEELDQKGNPKGYIARLHSTAVIKLDSLVDELAAISTRISPERIDPLILNIEKKLNDLLLNDETHAKEIREIKILLLELKIQS